MRHAGIYLCVTAPSPASVGAGSLRERARGIVPPHKSPTARIGTWGFFLYGRGIPRPYGYLPMPRQRRFNGFRSLNTVRAVFNPDAANTPPPGCMLAPVIYRPLMGVR